MKNFALSGFAVLATLAVAACASPTEAPKEGTDIVGQPVDADAAQEANAGDVSIKVYLPCTASQWNQADEDNYFKRGFFGVTSCVYNTESGYIVYTYTLPTSFA